MMRGLSGFIFVLLMSMNVFAADNVRECGRGRVGFQLYNWCVSHPAGSEPNDVVYYLHGMNGNEHQWNDMKERESIEQTWRELGSRAPSVITISFGKVWFLQDRSDSYVPAPLATFTTNVMPALEAKLGHPIKRRMLVGLSMGGFNVSQLIFKHTALFNRVALLCPLIPTINPHSSKEEVDAYIERHRPYIDENSVRSMMQMSRHIFRTKEEWNQHDPLVLAAAHLGPASPRMHISCGDRDKFGLYEGSLQLAELAAAKGTNVTWQPIAGGDHCAESPESLASVARFLVGFGELDFLAQTAVGF